MQMASVKYEKLGLKLAPMPSIGRCQVEGSAHLINENQLLWVKLSELPLILLTLLLNPLTFPFRVIERLFLD